MPGGLPSRASFLHSLRTSILVRSLSEGRIIHGQVCRSGMEGDLKLGSSLVNMYAKCGSLAEARHVFDALPGKNVVTWDVLISGYAQNGKPLQAFEAFDAMQRNGIKPIKVTFLGLLKICESGRATTVTMQHGREIHDQIVRHDFISDLEIGNTLVHMYAKWGSLREARRMFDSLMATKTVVSWSALIDGLVRHGELHSALEHFTRMQEEGVAPDEAAFSSALRACKSLELIEQGLLLHDQIIRRQIETSCMVGATIVDMYAKTGYLHEARRVLHSMPTRNVAPWAAMISAYTAYGFPDSAIMLFLEMQHMGCLEPDEAAFACTLKSCALLGAVHMGMSIHHSLMVDGLDSDAFLAAALVDMYAKSGCVAEARRVFDGSTGNRDIVLWGALIGGYVHCKELRLALECLDKMQGEGMKPVNAIYTSILSGCGEAGLIADGHLHFQHMTENLSIAPTMEQYSCIVDLLRKAGSLDEAKDLLGAMPMVPDDAAWTSLMSGCEAYGNASLGRECFHGMRMHHRRDGGEIELAGNQKSCIIIIPEMREPVDDEKGKAKKSGMTSKDEITWKEGPANAGIDNVVVVVAEDMLEHRRGRVHSLCGQCERLASALGLANSHSSRQRRSHSNMCGVCASCHKMFGAPREKN